MFALTTSEGFNAAESDVFPAEEAIAIRHIPHAMVTPFP
jgi:hypothetical protein